MTAMCDRAARLVRDRVLVAAYRAGATQSQLAREFGISPSGVSVILARHGARPTLAEMAARSNAAVRTKPPGPRPVWPDCPVHLRREYHKIRAVIGSRAARDQLLRFHEKRGQS